MKRFWVCVVLCAFFVASFTVVAPEECGANAFQVIEHGSRGSATAGLLVSLGDDPSAISYNPAGITQLDGVNMSTGIAFITPTVEYKVMNKYNGVTDVTTNRSKPIAVPNFYLTGKVNDKLALGVGTFARFGSAAEFEPTWAGRYNSYKSDMISLSLNPNIAYEITDGLSIAAGVEIMYMDLKLENVLDATKLLIAGGALPPTTPVNNPATRALDVDQELSGDDYGYGFNLALHYRPVDNFALGLTYRSKVKIEMNGSAAFVKSPAAAAMLPNWYNNTNFEAEVTLPDMFEAGVMFKPLDNLAIGISAAFIRWSTFDYLTVKYETNEVGLKVVEMTKLYDDVWRIGIGAEWNVTEYMDLRFGYLYDQCPVNEQHPDYLIPAGDRQAFSIGVGFHVDKFRFDMNYNLLMDGNMSIDDHQAQTGVLEGEMQDPTCNIIGFQISYQF